MEKRQRIAMLVVLARYNRFLESRGVIKTSGQSDHLLSEYAKTLSNPPEEHQN